MNEALIKATFFLSALSTENPEFPSVPLDPPRWKQVYSRDMTLPACENLVTRYRLRSLRAECDWDVHQLDPVMWFYYLQSCAMCGVTRIGVLTPEECESFRQRHLAEGLKTSQVCFQDENQLPDAGVQLHKSKDWDKHPDPIVQDCLERIGTDNECKG
jgi:hypothetical protein